jgi:hypothetical protein
MKRNENFVFYLYSWVIGFINTFVYSLVLITTSYIAIANQPSSQITMTCYPFPGNGFIPGTITSNHYEVVLPFPAAANSEDSTHFSFDYCSILLQLPNSVFASLITTLHGPNGKQPVLLTKVTYRTVA